MLVCRHIVYGRIRMDNFQYIKLNIVKPTFRADVLAKTCAQTRTKPSSCDADEGFPKPIS